MTSRRPVHAETYACWWLRLHGYRVVARNWRVSGGEVDIVAARGGVLAFVEVKGRRGGLRFHDDVVHPAQIIRLARAALLYRLAQRVPPGTDVRLDLMVVVGRGPWRRVTWTRGLDDPRSWDDDARGAGARRFGGDPW